MYRLKRGILWLVLIKLKIISSSCLDVLDQTGFVAQRFEIQSPLIEPNLRRNLGKWST